MKIRLKMLSQNTQSPTAPDIKDILIPTMTFKKLSDYVPNAWKIEDESSKSDAEEIDSEDEQFVICEENLEEEDSLSDVEIIETKQECIVISDEEGEVESEQVKLEPADYGDA